jgi:hypothetical protein
MKTINVPGFTAEASLFTMHERYRQAMALRPTNLDGVQPASCLSQCVTECRDFGHVHPSVCIRYCRNECAGR